MGDVNQLLDGLPVREHKPIVVRPEYVGQFPMKLVGRRDAVNIRFRDPQHEPTPIRPTSRRS